MELLGIESPKPDIPQASEVASQLFEQYGGKFPGTEEFSHQARTAFIGISPIESPDSYLIDIMEWESAIFRLFEERLIAARLHEGFTKATGGYDVEAFVKFSRSIGNRRFSRAGYAFEHHLRSILNAHSIRFVWHAQTEGKRTPDFIFPGTKEYHDPSYASASLRMLAAKTSCKDRWRQVINEAARIRNKHLLTLEPGISEAQTDEMKEENILLVVPLPILDTYTDRQKNYVMPFSVLLRELKNLQALNH